MVSTISPAFVGMVVATLALTGCNQPAQKPAAQTPTASGTPATPASTTPTATATTATASATATANPHVKIATESSFVPFSYKDANGKLVGFEIDLANALCSEAKLDCEIISQDWDGLIPGLTAKKYDAIMAGMSITPERSKVVAFSDPYFQNSLVVVAKKDSTITPADLSGKSVAAQRATVAAGYLAKTYPKARAKLYDTQENAYLDLEAGRAEVLLSDRVPAMAWLKTPKGQNFEIKGAPIELDDHIGIAFRQNDPLIGKFNTALTTLKGNGTYDKISQQYFSDIK